MSGWESAGKIFILLGLFLILFGVFFLFWQKIPFLGKLPGDIIWHKDGFFFFFPLVTSLVISLILTVILNLIFRLFR
jgi:hypothetical protein